MSLVSFLELLKHDVQGEVIENEVARVLIEFAKHSKRRVVICVNKGEVFDVQKRQDVSSVSLVNGNARVAWKEFSICNATCRMV